MAKHMPPVPPEQRSPKGPGAHPQADRKADKGDRAVPDTLDQQDRQGNIKQNTTHQGYQQDR